MKRFLSIALAVLMAVLCMPLSSAEDNAVRLYSVYGDGMLFQQKKDAVFAGEGKPNSIIEVTLTDENGTVAHSDSKVNADGTFSVSFTAPSGAFKEYTVILSQDGKVFETLERVVFGELWLASGQSNMQYPLGQAKHGYELFVNGERFSEWLRILMVPPYVDSYTQIGFVPDIPQKDIAGAQWIDGTDEFIYNMSAVAFYFADEMLRELKMPVGVLNASLGGSSILSWISRKKVDSVSEFKAMLDDYGMYKESKDWTAEDQNVYTDMGANYNHKIFALSNFRPAGMIWYQGETDIGCSDEYYSKAMDVMQDLFTETFSYEDGKFPLIYTNLAEYFYTEDGMVLPDRNIAFSEIRRNRPDSRATFAIYDLPITYLPYAGLIHPENKKEIGERMALCAKGMVYYKTDSFTGATVSTVELRDSAVYVTLRDVGNGLVATGDELYGFAVCGEDGIYVQAQAEIVSADTVKIWNESVKNPVSATYAYCMGNGRSNLACAYEGEDPLPVSIFITDRTVGKHYWTDKRWADCENGILWHTTDDKTSGFYDSWTAENAQISFSANDAYEGKNGLNIKAQPEGRENGFSISPVLTFESDGKTEVFGDADKDYSDYSKMSFNIRNNSDTDITLDAVKFYKNSTMWHAAAVEGTTDTVAVIPADGEWHTVTLDLNRIYLHGNEGGVAFTNEKLSDISNIEFCFSSGNGESVDMSFDNVIFTPSDEKVRNQFDAEFSNADGLFEFICVIFTRFFGIFAKLFR